MAAACAIDAGASTLTIRRPAQVACEAPFLVRVDGLQTPIVTADVRHTGYPSPYFRRRLVRQPLPTSFPAWTRAQAATAARRVGLDLDAPLVAIHARERRPETWAGRAGTTRNPLTRNMRIETFGDAVDLLTARGYTVVRMGDPSMTPYAQKGLIDLATHPASTALLQLVCFHRSACVIGSESGPAGAMSLWTNTPALVVNATDPISSYPVRASGRCLLKHVIDRQTGEPADVLSYAYLSTLRDISRWRYEDNTGAEIARATGRYLDDLHAPPPETPAEAATRARALAACQQWAGELGYLRKWGADDGFLGDGRIVA